MRPTPLLILTLCTALAGPALGYTLVADGAPRAMIVVPADAGAQRQATAELLQSYLAQSTGATLPIVDAPGDGVAIHLGRSAYVDALGLRLDELDNDGFVLKGVDEAAYVIAGPDEWGTEFGAVDFLERYVGVRWLLPGESGTHVPRHATLEVPGDEVRDEPVYFSRLMSGLRGEVQGEWARRNRMHGRISFHHNLYRLFPVSVFGETHPEFYPTINGEHYLPLDDEDQRWQPNFDAPGIVEAAVERIKQYFREHPEATSYSLGMNDSRNFDDAAAAPGDVNFLGDRDVSDNYYRWCNQVVEGVLEEFPDKWFGCLAYNNVAEPPSFDIHPRLVPFMTYDRMKWIDPTIRAEGERLTRQWSDNAERLGWYDYVYGTPYMLPRVYPHHRQDYLQWGASQGVSASYAELYPNWGEGPKPYVFLKLLWNPDLDIDALLTDWYTACVGPEAAPLLAEYYGIWERFWTKDILGSSWFRPQGQYLTFNSPLYLVDVDLADIRRSRELLDGVVARAQTPEQKARAELLERAFDYYEASALTYQAEVEPKQPPASEAEALAALDRAVEVVDAAGRRMTMVREFADHPVLVHPLDYDRYPQVRGEHWGVSTLWALAPWMDRSEAVRQRVAELAETGPENVRAALRTLQALTRGAGEIVSADPSFEGPGWGAWSVWVKFGTGTMALSDEQAKTGERSVKFTGMRRGGPHQTLKVPPGRYAAVGYVWVPEDNPTKATATVTATMVDENNLNLATPEVVINPIAGQWNAIVSPFEVKEEVDGKPVAGVRLIVIVDGMDEDDVMYVDDLALYRLPE